MAAIASCLMTTFRAMAANSGVEVLDYVDDSMGHLQRGEDGLYSIVRVTLEPTVIISPDSDADRARRLIVKAERSCLIGRSVPCMVVLEPAILQAHQVGT